MKKIIFSAIAIIAFSSSSMANTIEVEENIGQEKSKEAVINIFLLDPCLPAFMNTYKSNLEHYGSQVAAEIADAAWRGCRKALKLDDQ